jgi:hypothetical protein
MMRTHLAVLAVLLGSALAVAQPAPAPSDAKVAQADALFEEGRALEDQGKLKEACERYDESYAINPAALGVMIHVAQCQSRFDKVATALAMYVSARDHAREAHADEIVAVAEDNIAKLTPIVPHLQVVVADHRDDLVVSIDGKRVAVADLADLQLDPGPHDIVVVAPDRHPHRERVVLAKRDRRALKIAELEHVHRLAIPIAITSAGGALLIAGIVTGAIASGNYHTALKNDCTNEDANKCTAKGVTATNQARQLGDIGTAIAITGVAALAVGGVLGWRAWPRDEDRAVAVVPVVGDGSVGIVATGRF